MTALLVVAVVAVLALGGYLEYTELQNVKARGCYQCQANLYWYGTMDTFFEGTKLSSGVYVCKACLGKLSNEIEGKEPLKIDT